MEETRTKQFTCLPGRVPTLLSYHGIMTTHHVQPFPQSDVKYPNTDAIAVILFNYAMLMIAMVNLKNF